MTVASDITCWEDAGSWSSRADLNCGSIFRRLQAVHAAISERYQILGETFSRPEPVLMGSILECVSDLTVGINHLAEYGRFADALDGVFRQATLYSPYCANQVWQNLNIRSGLNYSQTFSPGSGEGNGTRDFRFQIDPNGAAVLSAGQTAFNDELEEAPASLVFAVLDGDVLLETYPVQFELCGSLGNWLWNAYQALRRMTCPLYAVYLFVMPHYDASAQEKRVLLYTDGNGYQCYRLSIFDPYVTPQAPVTEAELWSMALPRPAYEYNAVSSRMIEDRTREADNPFSAGTTCTRTDIFRRYYSASLKNSCMLRYGTENLYCAADIRLQRCFTKRYLESPYGNNDHAENEWCDLIRGTIEANGTVAYGDTDDSIPTGQGESTDATRRLEIAVSFDLANPADLSFI